MSELTFQPGQSFGAVPQSFLFASRDRFLKNSEPIPEGTWSAQGAALGAIQSLAHGNGITLQAGTGTTTWIRISHDDGQTWTSAGLNVRGRRVLRFIDGWFYLLAISSLGFTSIYRTPNGTSWDLVFNQVLEKSSGFVGIARDRSGRFVVITNRGEVFSSLNGIDWAPYGGIPIPSSDLASQVSSLTYGNGRFVSGASSSNAGFSFWVSEDAITWRGVSSAGSLGAVSIESLEYRAGNFVAVDTNRWIHYSGNGTSWRRTSYLLPLSSGSERRISALGPWIYILGGLTGSWRSLNGETWQEVTATGGLSIDRAVEIKGRFRGSGVLTVDGATFAPSTAVPYTLKLYRTEGEPGDELDEQKVVFTRNAVYNASTPLNFAVPEINNSGHYQWRLSVPPTEITEAFDDIVHTFQDTRAKIARSVELSSALVKGDNAYRIDIDAHVSGNVGQSQMNYTLYRTTEEPVAGEGIPEGARKKIEMTEYTDSYELSRGFSFRVYPPEDSYYAWSVGIADNAYNDSYQSTWGDEGLTHFAEGVDVGEPGTLPPIVTPPDPEEPVDPDPTDPDPTDPDPDPEDPDVEEPEVPVQRSIGKIVEQEMLIFLRENGWDARSLAPVNPEEVTKDFVTITRTGNVTDIINRMGETTIVLDCFIAEASDPEINNRSRFDAERMAVAIRDDMTPFLRKNKWIRRVTDSSLTDSSDSRFTYYTLEITFVHQI